MALTPEEKKLLGAEWVALDQKADKLLDPLATLKRPGLPENWEKSFCNVPAMLEEMLNASSPEQRLELAQKAVAYWMKCNEFILLGDEKRPGLLPKMFTEEEARQIFLQWADANVIDSNPTE